MITKIGKLAIGDVFSRKYICYYTDFIKRKISTENKSTIYRNKINMNFNIQNSQFMMNNSKTFISNRRNIYSYITPCYSTQNKSTNTSNQNKKNTKKALLYTIAITSSSILLYHIYSYYTDHTYYTIKPLTSLISKTHRLFSSIYSFMTLPYHSFVLLDKLIPTTKNIEKTLVINLNKTLVAYKYSLFSGFEILKRPGIIKFLEELSQIYEIVIFSNEDTSIVEEISNSLDPTQKYISSKLGKEAIRIYKGKPIKDLSYLNRNLNNVIVLDVNIDNVPLHPNNTIIVPEFKGDGKDRELLYLMVFLKEMGRPSVIDIRSEIKKWGNYKPYLKFYNSNAKFKKFLPNVTTMNDDRDIAEIRKSNSKK